jgi:hypothetical protein
MERPPPVWGLGTQTLETPDAELRTKTNRAGDQQVYDQVNKHRVMIFKDENP